MTEEQIKQNAEAYADVFGRHMVDYYGVKDAFIAGAHSRNDEVKELKEKLKFADESIADADKWIGKYKLEIYKLQNPWISVEVEKPVEGKDVIFMLPNGLVYKGFRKVIGIRDRVFLRCAPKGTNCYMISDVTHWMPMPELKKGK